MSKYFIVDIVESEESCFHDEGNKVNLNKQEYLEFIEFAKKEGKLELILKNINFSCRNCNAFTISSRTLYETIADAYDFDGIQAIARHLIEPIPLTDEEWTIYMNYGQEKVESLKSRNIIKVEMENEEICKFVSEEVFFRFDKTCNCSNLLLQ